MEILYTNLHVNFFEEFHVDFMFLHFCSTNSFEVEFILFHFDNGVFYIRKADREDDVFRSLSPDTARWMDPLQLRTDN